MNLSRRDLLGALLAAAALTAVGEKFAPPQNWIAGDWFRHLGDRAIQSIDGYYTVVLHPSVVADMVAADARMRWKQRYRAERLARRGVVEPPITGEIGRFHSVRYVIGEKLKGEEGMIL